MVVIDGRPINSEDIKGELNKLKLISRAIILVLYNVKLLVLFK